MNNVDLFIKYLSGEMNREEIASFEKDLANNQGFKKEFDLVFAAYNLIGNQLRKRDEDEFNLRLLEVMKHPPTGNKQGVRSLPRLWYYLLPLAASLAVLLGILLSSRSEDKLFSMYYHPEDDRVLITYMQGTRGRAESGILSYQKGNYTETMIIMQELMEEDPENLQARLYFLLSSIETGKENQAIEKLADLDPDLNHQLGQAVSWYTALALLKSDQAEEALPHLHSLIQQEGPYQADAIRLEKNLLK